MVMSSTVISRTTNATKANIDTGMAMSTKEHGKMMLRMDLGNYTWKMAKIMKVSLLKDKNMERECIHGRMEIDIKGSLHSIREKG